MRMNSQPVKSNYEWVDAFAQEGVVALDAPLPMYAWATALVARLQHEKPEQEIHLLAFSRVPRTSSYLLASSAKNYLHDKPSKLHMNEKLADAFLGPVSRGVRIFREEMPLPVSFDLKSQGGEAKRQEISLYDAVCFDTKDVSIVVGLVLTDIELDELFTNEEVAALSRVVFAQGAPMLEGFIFRASCAEKDEELNLVSRLVRSGAVGDIAHSSGENSLPRVTKNPFNENVSQDFFEYIVAQWRQSWNDINHAIDSSGADLLPAMERQDRMIRNLSNIGALLHANVKPQIEIMTVGEFADGLHEPASNCARRAGVALELDSPADAESIAVDAGALIKLCEKLMDFHFGYYSAENATITAEIPEGPEGIDFIALRIADDGTVEDDAQTPTNLKHLDGGQAMRLRSGGGILYLLGALLLRKGGGQFRIRPVETGYCVELLLPRAAG
ncbi:MAG: hypothetical protein ABI579_05830 [Candidatus Sumerlaeota bacterium]